MSARRIIDDQYEIIRKIKAGGFGSVYYGWDLTLDRPVAVKEIVQSLLGEQQYVDMFIDEARNTARLNHPNIVQVYSLRKTSDNRVFIVMQYIEGVDLKDVIDLFNQRDMTMPKNLVVHIVGEVCKALEYAHSLKDRKSGEPLNIVHRDVSPSNIMLTVEGSVKLIDFGIAKARHRVAKKTQTGFVKGKVSYLAPEQLEGKEASRQSDIFSLGAVFYELFTGNQAFVGDSDFTIMKKIVTANVDFSCLDEMNLPGDCCRIIRKALTKDMSQRYASANEMYVDLYKLGREHYPGEPTSELSRFVHELSVKVPEKESDKPGAANGQKKIETKVMAAAPEPTPEPEEKKTEPPQEEIKPQKEPEPPKEEVKPEKKPVPKPPESKPEADGDEAKTVIYDTSQDEAKTTLFDAPEDDAKTIVRDLPHAKEKSKKPGFDLANLTDTIKKLDRRVLIYGGGALGVLIILLIIAALLGGGGTGPKGSYRVWINSEPEGADVFINDSNFGRTPLQIAKLEDGVYSLRLRLDQGQLKDTQFVLEPDENLIFPNFIFTSDLYINSIPQDAAIFIDNIDIGRTTPALVPLPLIDSVDIRLEHAGGKTPLALSAFKVTSGAFRADKNNRWEYTFSQEDDRPELLGRFLCEINITSKPQGADIYVDDGNRPLGQTPGQFLVPYGSVKLRLSKTGFEDKIRTVNITEQNQGPFSYELFREVQITSVAASDKKGADIGATIYKIESEGKVAESSDRTPAKLLLTGVEHKIYLGKDGFRDTAFVIGVNQAELKAVLSKIEEKPTPVPSQEERDTEKAFVVFVVTDKKSKEPLEGVDILAERKSDKKKVLLGSTNEYGRLAEEIEADNYKFIANLDGYKDWDDGKRVKKNREYKFEVKLRRK
jgi:serine/threonine protein kinase